jgi:hypothetical protein
MFSEMDLERFPISSDEMVCDWYVANRVRTQGEREKDFKPEFDRKLSIRHHKMTLALAMPDKVMK